MADANTSADAQTTSADAETKKLEEGLKKLEAIVNEYGIKVYSDEEMQDAINRRQDALNKLRAKEEAEKKASEEDAKKKGKFEQLLSEREKELAALKAEKETLATDVAKFREKQEALKKTLLEKITDADLKKFGEKLDVDELTLYVEKVTGNKFAGAPKGSLDTTKAPQFKSFDEWQKYMKENNLVS